MAQAGDWKYNPSLSPFYRFNNLSTSFSNSQADHCPNLGITCLVLCLALNPAFSGGSKGTKLDSLTLLGVNPCLSKHSGQRASVELPACPAEVRKGGGKN